MEECSAKSQKQCTCTCISCENHGNCCKCIAYHQKSGEIPGCFFTPEGERTQDRSLKNFFLDRGAYLQ